MLQKIATNPRVHLFGIIVVLFGFVIALVAQWQGSASIAETDSVSYIVGGVNLITIGHFINPFGFFEDWFPPVYPLLIGAVSFGGQLDTVLVGRLISVAMGLITVVLVWYCVRSRDRMLPMMALASAICLACNSLHQGLSSSVVSNPTATCFVFAAIVLWLSLNDHPRALHVVRYAVIGLLFGLSSITRAEPMIFLPLLALWDFVKRGFTATVRQYLIAFAVMAAVLLPYAIYLHNVTGKWAISGKAEINIADGRSEFYHIPLRFIDPNDLEMKYSAYPISFSSEAHRYADNILKIGKAYLDIYRLPLAFALLLCALFGMRFLILRGQWRFLFGLLVPFACLPVIGFFHVNHLFLHITLPSLSILIGIGLAYLVHQFPCRLSSAGIVQAVILLAAVACLIEGGTREGRWTLITSPDRPPRETLLRDAGRNFTTLNLPQGSMYEMGATVGFYAKQMRRRITTDVDLPTLVHFMKHHESGPVYLALTTLATYNRSLQELLNTHQPPPPFEKVLELADSRGKVVIFRMQVQDALREASLK